MARGWYSSVYLFHTVMPNIAPAARDHGNSASVPDFTLAGVAAPLGRYPTPPWKRPLDLLLIAVSAPFTIPVALVVAGFIKLVSPGPVLFLQERIGMGGRRFRCFKFRTMSPNADQSLHQVHVAKIGPTDSAMTKLDSSDPRLIPFGRWLRASGIDELPQLLNVIRGDMSVVGPRPCMTYELRRHLPAHMERFRALPGITGLWQVSGKNRTTVAEMIRLDIHYARHASVMLDLIILARTPWVVLMSVVELIRNRGGGRNSGNRKPAPIYRSSSSNTASGSIL